MNRLFGVNRIIILFVMMIISFANAQLKIQVTKAANNAIPIGVVASDSSADGLRQIVIDDLARSGRFVPLSGASLPENITQLSQLNSEPWVKKGVQYSVFLLLQGTQLSAEIINTYSKQSMLKRTYTVNVGNDKQLRKTAHQVADMIYEQVLGVKGSFDTKVAYVSKNGRNYQLVVSDADGAYPSVIFTSQEPILSPSWSPDGRKLAYSSLEGKRSQIVVQDVYSGQRYVALNHPGINSAPSWSPDGNRLVFTLSKDGNPEIYTSDLRGNGLVRVTNSPSIDTEPVWSKDGMIYFTSDRSGSPQVYRVNSSGGVPVKVTNAGAYNASPSISKDGRYLATMQRGSNGFGIALTDLTTGATKRLTNGGKDESPSFSSNGHMIIYADGRGGLNAISSDGNVAQRFSSAGSDVREPSWSGQ